MNLERRVRFLPDGIEANASLNFDQYEQDRTLQLVYGEYQGKQTAGLVADRSATVEVADPQGKPRVRLLGGCFRNTEAGVP